MPLFKIGQKTSTEKNKSKKESSPAARGEAQLSPGLETTPSPILPEVQRFSDDHIVLPSPTDSPKTVRIDETSFTIAARPAGSTIASVKSAEKRKPVKSSFASRKASREPLNEPPPRISSQTSIADSFQDGYQSSQESVQDPSTPGTSIGSSVHIPNQQREIAQGFEKRIALLPPPPPRISSNMKISLGHGRDGSRPAFRVASPSRSKSPRSPRSPKTGKRTEGQG